MKTEHAQVVPLVDYKVEVKHKTADPVTMYSKPFFSEITNYYSKKNTGSIPVKKHHTLNSLLERLNNITTNPDDKYDSIAILKGLYNGGTSGSFCYEAAPFLFFDIDVNKDKNENTHLLDANKNAKVFAEIQKIALLVFRSNSGRGMAGIFYVPQLQNVFNKDRRIHLSIGKAVNEYVKEKLKIDADFDNTQSKFRQVRLLAKQTTPRRFNKRPLCFEYELKEIPRRTNTGVKQYTYLDNRESFGSIAQQFNQATNIQTALIENGFKQLSGDRYKHPSTTSSSTGVVGQSNVFFNHSSSFSNYKVFTPFWLYLTQGYKNDLHKFLKDLKEKGYQVKQPQQKTILKSRQKLKTQSIDRNKQIFEACFDLVNLPYLEKVKFIKENARNDQEKILFQSYLKVKPLILSFDKTFFIEKHVSEKIADILAYSDLNKRTILNAETGTGKTTAFLKYFKEHRPTKRLLVLAPLTVIVDQNKNNFRDLITLTAKSLPETHTEAKTAMCVMATYEQGYKHLLDGNKFDYVIIDEVHNLITANSFKNKAIRNLVSVLHDKRVIGLTGTTNLLFKAMGYKLVQVRTSVLSAVPVSMRIDNRNTLSIALNHLKNIKGKCIIRINSRENARLIKNRLIAEKRYTENEVLILNSDKTIKEGLDFLRLSQKGDFRETVKVVLTTSVIDEGLSIRQSGFTDVVFIETNYHPMPESVKQFFARFRNEDPNRKNYYYFRETKKQVLNDWNPLYEFTRRKKELTEDAKNRDVRESTSRDFANNDYLFFDNGIVNSYALSFDISFKFFQKVTTAEFINFLELNYNLKIKREINILQTKIDTKDLQAQKKTNKALLGQTWVNKRDEVLNVLYRLTDSRAIKKSVCFTGLNPDDEIYNLVHDNLKEFERLQRKTMELEALQCDNVDSVLIDPDNFTPRDGRLVNTKISLLHTLEVLNNPKTETDKRNKIKIKNFIDEVGTMKSFDAKDLARVWKKQRSNSIHFNTVILREIVLQYHEFVEDKKYRKWIKTNK